MQRILRTIEQICLAPPLDQTESAMADLAGPRKINFVCMKLYTQFVYKLAIQLHSDVFRGAIGPWPPLAKKFFLT